MRRHNRNDESLEDFADQDPPETKLHERTEPSDSPIADGAFVIVQSILIPLMLSIHYPAETAVLYGLTILLVGNFVVSLFSSFTGSFAGVEATAWFATLLIAVTLWSLGERVASAAGMFSGVGYYVVDVVSCFAIVRNGGEITLRSREINEPHQHWCP